jgi:hypothetical protein
LSGDVLRLWLCAVWMVRDVEKGRVGELGGSPWKS